MPRSTALAQLLLALAACDEAPAERPAGQADAGANAGADGGRLETPDAGATLDAEATPDARPVLKVLFVGNSYTAVNDLPATVRALAEASPGPTLEVEAITVGGARLADHWASTGARDRILRAGLDAVVLQGQSVETLFSPADFDQHATLFAGALAQAGARGVWFATWARRDLEGDPLAIAQAIEARYRAAAAHNGDVVARVGAAWEIWLYTSTGLPLFDADRSHPSPAGSLLAACVLYQALTGTTARLPDPPPLGVPADLATRLCALAEGGVRCNAGESECDGTCVPWDRQTCGGCGVACAPGDPCRRGVCGCDPGRTGCDGVCVDTSSNPLNCGGCGESCQGAACQSGGCVCPASGRQDFVLDRLPALEPTCEPFNGAGSLACNAAAHRYCAQVGGGLACFRSGFGPPSGHAPMANAVMCLPGDVRLTSYAALAQHVPACDGVQERLGQSCATAISRFCAAQGAVSGFGPVASAGDDLTVSCVSTATVVRTDLTTLAGFASRCSADPVSCSVASWNYCEFLGYPAGFGPVEVSGDQRDIVCAY